MSWTNITIPDRFSTSEQCLEKIAELEFKNKRMNEKLDWYEREFRNLFLAAKEFKEIELTEGKEKIKLRLVEDSND
jgi:hypothetical protein